MPAASPRVRVDAGVRAGDSISPYYDPMLAKLIVWGEDRDRACEEMVSALHDCQVVGVATNVAFLERLVAHEAFASGRLDTGLIETHRAALFPSPSPTPERALIIAALGEYAELASQTGAHGTASGDPHSPWNATDAWWNGSATHAIKLMFADRDSRHPIDIRPQQHGHLRLRVGDRQLEASGARENGRLTVAADGATLIADVVRVGDERWVFAPGLRCRLTRVDPLAHAGEDEAPSGHLMAPMSGTIVSVLVKPGERVAKGRALIVLEAMKMEHTIAAPMAGVIAAVNYGVGDRVPEGADLVDLDDSST